MPERVIRQIDLLVHPDYHVIPFSGYGADSDQIELRRGWDARIEELAIRNDALLFYFPAVDVSQVSTRDIPRLKTPEQFELEYQEMLRRKRYADLLGNKYFYFGIGKRPSRQTILEIAQRGFSYNPLETLLVAYGEFLNLCVAAWQTSTGETLGIPTLNQQKLEPLSVKDALNLNQFLRTQTKHII